MPIELKSFAEQAAVQAEDLQAFRGIKLLHIKKQVEEILSFIGRNGIFQEYTVHDISHIDAMLTLLEWIVPNASRQHMTPADWLLVTLSVYLHDMGMLVTEDEFAARNSSSFNIFKHEILHGESANRDYEAKVTALGTAEAERFLYQEFVRDRHADRIRSWISGRPSPELGLAYEAMGQVESLLAPLDTEFRNDLALVCESHHRDDLADTQKYPLSQPYGPTAKETANVQYAAILLRTADLLHMSRDRAPSISYRLINPSDPISQREWAKQGSVRQVRPRPALDDEGTFDASLQSDTIEVHATFKDPDGFFGLTSYLGYVEKQLRQSHDWSKASAETGLTALAFPWRYIDASRVRADGFLGAPFEFTLDNARVLDLLTGHTLYNDTGVVVRELVQNSLDAVRLQSRLESARPQSDYTPQVRIAWNSQTRLLTVEDNGTGMTQRIVEDNFLKVGASHYQSDEFRQRHPNFSPISRFGIGVLSAFMIADDVHVTTVHPDEKDARSLRLRSVHGRYLIKLLDKQNDTAVRTLMPHGTRIELRLRASAEDVDVLWLAKNWIVVPGCKVTVSINDHAAQTLGFAGAGEALRAAVEETGLRTSAFERERLKIVEKSSRGLDLAFLVQWSQYFQSWSFVTGTSHGSDDRWGTLFGVCIEGVKVESNPPGFEGSGVVAVANATGPKAPRTNVARSRLENTDNLRSMLAATFEAYCEHIQEEFERLTREGYSLSWAVREARYLASTLIAHPVRIAGGEGLSTAAKKLPLFIIEEGGERLVASAADMESRHEFWTMRGVFFKAAETLLSEVSGHASISKLLAAMDGNTPALPEAAILCTSNLRGHIDDLALRSWEIDLIRVDGSRRRVDFRWRLKDGVARWHFLTSELIEESLAPGAGRRSRRELPVISATNSALAVRRGLLIASDSVAIDSPSDINSVYVDGSFYLFGSNGLGVVLRELLQTAHDSRDSSDVRIAFAATELAMVAFQQFTTNWHYDSPVGREQNLQFSSDGQLSEGEVSRFFASRGVDQIPKEKLDAALFGTLLKRENTSAFNPAIVRRDDAE